MCKTVARVARCSRAAQKKSEKDDKSARRRGRAFKTLDAQIFFKVHHRRA